MAVERAGAVTSDPGAVTRILAQEYFSKPGQAVARLYDLAAYDLVNMDIRRPVLDLGCGVGAFGSVFSRVYGLDGLDLGSDPNSRDVRLARRRGVYKLAFQSGARALPIKTGMIRSIICHTVLCCVHPAHDSALEEVARILETGGQFGENFAESGTVLRLLAELLFLNGLNRILGVFLMSCDRQVQMTRSQWTAASINILGNLLLIPAFGVKGAAVATLISEMLLLILFVVQLRPVLRWPVLGSRWAISGLGVASFFLTFAFLPSLSLFAVIPAATLLYSATLISFKETRTNEVQMLVSLLKRRL